MGQPQRLFDCLELQMKEGGNPAMLAAKEQGSWKEYSTRESITIIDGLAAGLINSGYSTTELGTESRSRIAVIAKNRPEWMFLDLAVQKMGAILVPLYPTIHVADLEFVLNDARVTAVFVNDADQLTKVNEVKDRCPNLKDVYSFEKIQGIRHWSELLKKGSQADHEMIETISSKITSEDLLTIIYTSGTTGTPKGVMLSHRNILTNVIASIPCFPPGENMRSLSFLPLNHIFERMVTYLYLFKNTSIFYAESLETIADNLREVKPHLFTTVPRLLEKVYDRIMQKGADLTGVKKKLFFWAHGLAEKFELEGKSPGYKMQLALANKLIFSKWREALGNNLKCIVTGGAACQVRLIRIFTAANIDILEGYGLTETSPVIAVNRFERKDRKFGTVGPLLDNVEVKIANDGEILCKGPNIMMGYYKRPDLTAECMIDGWYATGDIGEMIDGRYLKITDRKKELFKTSGGKYVAPLAVENKLKESTFIEQVMVVGSGKKFVGALIVPAFANLKDWCSKHNIATSENSELIKNEKVIQKFSEEVQKLNEDLNHVEQVKRFKLLADEWTVDTGEMTPKLSLKRKVVASKFENEIDGLYFEHH